MRKIAVYMILCFAMMFYAFGVAAQDSEIQIGIEEKLGQTIPLDLSFYDEEGQPVVLKDMMMAKPTLLVLAFFSCEGICKPLLGGLAEAVGRSPETDPGKDYQIITVSFDPKDDPATAKEMRAMTLEQVGRPLPDEAWRFLTGNQENIDKLCDAVGFRYIKQTGTFIHSGVVTVLSATGKVVRYIYGGNISRDIMPFLPFELQMALMEASEGRIGSTVNKVLRLCFQYDQEGKRYVLSVTRIVMVIVLLFAIMVLLYVTKFSKVGSDRDKKTVEETDRPAL
ncbi:SCO family protein [Oligoflexia bacterium]|nr:SCO family protein [Oligoflexia bacterium]